MSRVRVITPSRLHFGLFGWGPDAPRQFGGVGLMVDEPGLEVLVEPADRWDAAGPLADRALGLARQVGERLASEGHAVNPSRVTVVRAPRAHVGLGVGTQLSLAVARAVAEGAGLRGMPASALARLTGRGRRSGIGIHGFAEGGLIVDGGRRGEQDVPARLVRLALPPTWWILVVIPDRATGLSGQAETVAFDKIPSIPQTTTDRLCRLVLLGLMPAVVESDLGAFGRALTEVQELVGAAFAPVQGGCFARPQSDALLGRLKSLGMTGVGQSSWGPTLYAFTDADAETRAEIRSKVLAASGLTEGAVLWTRASEAGATARNE